MPIFSYKRQNFKNNLIYNLFLLILGRVIYCCIFMVVTWIIYFYKKYYMPITKEVKQKIISDFADKKWNTGSPEVQVAILTANIENLKLHLSIHKKDVHSRRWIMMMVAKRRKMLNYLKKTNPAKYDEVIEKLEIRK